MAEVFLGKLPSGDWNCTSLMISNRVSRGQGKVREIPYQAKVRELSGNFVVGQVKLKMLWKVREKWGNFERVMAMVVSWVIWNILDNILIHCWWSCWHQWLGCQAPMIHWIFHWCQISWYTIFPVTMHGNYSLHMKLKGFGLQSCVIVVTCIKSPQFGVTLHIHFVSASAAAAAMTFASHVKTVWDSP